jgi:hypothetical protein
METPIGLKKVNFKCGTAFEICGNFKFAEGQLVKKYVNPVREISISSYHTSWEKATRTKKRIRRGDRNFTGRVKKGKVAKGARAMAYFGGQTRHSSN